MHKRAPWKVAICAAGLVLAAGVASGRGTAVAADGFVCPASAKPANLNFTLKNLNGADVRLADFEDRVILLDFWATWCGPCKIEIPWFVDLQSRYGSRGLQVLGISVDDTLDALKPYVVEHQMNYPVLQGLGHDEVVEAFGPIEGLPTTFVIARDGRVCATHEGLTGKDHFEREIEALLQQAGR